jgi:hypothetical protein
MDAITFIQQAVTRVHEQMMASLTRSIHAFDDDVESYREMEAAGQRRKDHRDDLTFAALRFRP